MHDPSYPPPSYSHLDVSDSKDTERALSPSPGPQTPRRGSDESCGTCVVQVVLNECLVLYLHGATYTTYTEESVLFLTHSSHPSCRQLRTAWVLALGSSRYKQ